MQGDKRCKITFKIHECFAWKCIHEIQADICKTCPTGSLYRFDRLCARMNSADLFQQSVLKTLCTKRQAIDAKRTKRPQLIQGYRTRITLDRKLKVLPVFPHCLLFQKDLAYGAKDIFHHRPAKDAWRTAADIDGSRHAVLVCRRSADRLYFLHKCTDIVFHLTLFPCLGGKIAVKAFALAKRNMNVNAVIHINRFSKWP